MAEMREPAQVFDPANVHAIAAATQVLQAEARHTREIMERIEQRLAESIEQLNRRQELTERRLRSMMLIMALVSGGISAAAVWTVRRAAAGYCGDVASPFRGGPEIHIRRTSPFS